MGQPPQNIFLRRTRNIFFLFAIRHTQQINIRWLIGTVEKIYFLNMACLTVWTQCKYTLNLRTKKKHIPNKASGDGMCTLFIIWASLYNEWWVKKLNLFFLMHTKCVKLYFLYYKIDLLFCHWFIYVVKNSDIIQTYVNIFHALPIQ